MGYGTLVYLSLFIVGVIVGCYAPTTAEKLYFKFAPMEEVICRGRLVELQRRIQNGWTPDLPLEGVRASPLTRMFFPDCRYDWVLLSELIKAGADPNGMDRNGNLPIDIAASNAIFEAVSRLVNNGADVNKRNGQGNTAIMELGPGGPAHVHMAKFLITLGADVTMLDVSGRPSWALAETKIDHPSYIVRRAARELVALLKAEAEKHKAP